MSIISHGGPWDSLYPGSKVLNCKKGFRDSLRAVSTPYLIHCPTTADWQFEIAGRPVYVGPAPW